MPGEDVDMVEAGDTAEDMVAAGDIGKDIAEDANAVVEGPAYVAKISFVLSHFSTIHSLTSQASPDMARYRDHYYLWEYFSFPLHLVFFVFILFFVLAFSWYINYESVLEDLLVQVKILLALVPLLLLLVVHCLSSPGSFPIPLPEERESLHRAGGSPWGVALLLLFVLFMVAYQSSFHQRWFPLVTR
ncbi:transmembrane protein [Spatholobus suberectus]|nr:transmembrane protein [Spatholobus suberectus]